MDALILFAWLVLLIYLVTRKWFWMAVIAFAAIALLFTPIGSLIGLLFLIMSGFIVLHLFFIVMMFVFSTLFLFS